MTDIKELHRAGWALGLRANKLRDYINEHKEAPEPEPEPEAEAEPEEEPKATKKKAKKKAAKK